MPYLLFDAVLQLWLLVLSCLSCWSFIWGSHIQLNCLYRAVIRLLNCWWVVWFGTVSTHYVSESLHESSTLTSIGNKCLAFLLSNLIPPCGLNTLTAVARSWPSKPMSSLSTIASFQNIHLLILFFNITTSLLLITAWPPCLTFKPWFSLRLRR